MAKRLDIDSHVVAYWGFDEANETDPGLDETPAARHVVFTSSPAVVPARVSNGRQFDGAATVATPSDSSPFRLAGDLTIITWAVMDQVNSGGSFLRTILECAGPGPAQADNCLFGLYISNAGEIVYQHDSGADQPTIFKTAPNVVRVGRYYSIALQRQANVVRLFVDNQPLAWASCTVNGVAQSPTLAVPAPDGGTAAVLRIGQSIQYADGAKWQGILDEVSIHDVARLFHPYLRSAYFRLTLYTLFFKLSILNNVRSIGSAEMGGGSRWWVYERDQSLYAVRENTLGLFSPEVQLTSGGLQPNGTVAPGGTGTPEVIYDRTTDTLYVAFITAGRVYKLTASVGDAPATQLMPYTVDTATIVKVRESYEATRVGAGGANDDPKRAVGWVSRQPIKIPFVEPTVSVGAGASEAGKNTKTGDVFGWGETVPSAPPTIFFTTTPVFGVVIPDSNSYGYAVFSVVAGVEKYLGRITVLEPSFSSRYVFPITSRVYGMRYFAKAIDLNGRIGLNRSNLIQDLFGQMDIGDTANYPNVLDFNLGGDAPDLMHVGAGGSSLFHDVAYVNRSPLKMATSDSAPAVVGAGGGLLLTMDCTPSVSAPQRRRIYA